VYEAAGRFGVEVQRGPLPLPQEASGGRDLLAVQLHDLPIAAIKPATTRQVSSHACAGLPEGGSASFDNCFVAGALGRCRQVSS
jgi:hypothetical protein